jgi:phage baseplate assembly protein W
MLQVLDQNGVDLLLSPFALMARQIVSGQTPVPIYATVQDPTERVRAVLDWNDGSQPVIFPEQDSPLVVSFQRELGLGTYNIALTAFNTRTPVPDQLKVLFPWQITQLNPVAAPARNIFGPILPRDNGLPNTQSWNFDLDSDLRVLQANLKMLLITAKGERVMLPTYGTNIKRIIFELNVASVETILQQEIAQAVALWEPRVTLQSIGVKRDANNRQVAVQAAFLSRQSGQVFETSLQFAQ